MQYLNINNDLHFRILRKLLWPQMNLNVIMNGELFCKNQLNFKIVIMEVCTTFPCPAKLDRWTQRFLEMDKVEFIYYRRLCHKILPSFYLCFLRTQPQENLSISFTLWPSHNTLASINAECPALHSVHTCPLFPCLAFFHSNHRVLHGRIIS